MDRSLTNQSPDLSHADPALTERILAGTTPYLPKSNIFVPTLELLKADGKKTAHA